MSTAFEATAIRPPASDDLIGRELEGRYRILERVGAGGMGQVYRARQLNVDRDVAVKVIGQALADDASAVERFSNEAKIVSRLRHPNTLRLFDFGHLPDGRLFIVTELLVGTPLDRAVAHGPLGERRTLATLRQIAESLTEAHAQGVVHRDLKPHNVFLESVGDQEVAKVLDFGVAKLSAGAVQTAAGALIGTPAYMSPEQARGEPADARSDLYSLGVLAYQCLTGRLPFEAETPMGVLFKQISTPPPDVPPHLASEPLRALVQRLLAKDAAARPSSANEVKRVIAELEHGLAPGSSGADLGQGVDPFARTHLRSRRPARVRRWAVGALVLALGAVIALVALRSRWAHRPAASLPPSTQETLYRIRVGDSPIRGPANALVTIVEFGDFQCPYTKIAESFLREILAAHPDEVRLVWKDYPLADHPQSLNGALLAQEAYLQKGTPGFWAAHDRLFDLQPWLEPAGLDALRHELGLTEQRLDLYHPEADRIAHAIDALADLGLSNVPQFFINGRRVTGADREDLDRVVLEELEHARQLRASGVPVERIYDQATEAGVTSLPRPVFAPLPTDGAPVLGGDSDAVLVERFCDLGDLFCAWSDAPLLQTLRHYGDRVRVVYFDTPNPDQPYSLEVAKALVVARELQGELGFWNFHDLLTERIRAATNPAGELAPPPVQNVAVDIGLDRRQFAGRLAGNFDGLMRYTEARRAMGSGGLNGLVLIDGKAYVGIEPRHELEAAIDAALAARHRRGAPAAAEAR